MGLQVLLLLAAFCASVAVASAAPADLDASWDQDGIALGSGPGAEAVAMLPDGKTVVGGGRGLRRYHADGRLDTSFGQGGVATTLVGVYDIARQPDGKIVVVGIWDEPEGPPGGIGVSRHHPDGSVDEAFGVRAQYIAGRYSEATSVAVAGDGRIYVGVDAATNNGYTPRLATIAALRPNGELDPTFDGDGSADLIDGYAEGRSTYASALAIQPDGKLIVAGGGGIGGEGGASGRERFFLARLQRNGTPDRSFGGDGFVETRIGYSSAAHGVAIQPDGKIVAAGMTSDGTIVEWLEQFSGRRFALARYHRDGSLDRGFDGDGIAGTAMGSGSMASEVALLKGGGILAIGSERSVFPSRFALARYRPNGSLDPGFDDDGRLATAIGQSSGARDVALQRDGKVVVAGAGENWRGEAGFALARYLGDGVGSPAPPPDPVPAPFPPPGPPSPPAGPGSPSEPTAPPPSAPSPPSSQPPPVTPRAPVVSTRIAVLAPSRFVLRGRRPKLTVRIQGTPGATSSMVLKRSGRVVARRTLVLTGPTTRATLRLPARARSGRHLLTVSMPGADGKPIRGTVAVRVVRPRR